MIQYFWKCSEIKLIDQILNWLLICTCIKVLWNQFVEKERNILTSPLYPNGNCNISYLCTVFFIVKPHVQLSTSPLYFNVFSGYGFFFPMCFILDPVNHLAFSNFGFVKKENQTGTRGLAKRTRYCYLLKIKNVQR